MTCKIELSIKNSASLSWLEMKEAVDIIDRFILSEIFIRRQDFTGRLIDFFGIMRPIGRPPNSVSSLIEDQVISFIEIDQVRQGSVILTVIIGGAATFSIAAIAKGIHKSKLADEIARTGELAGNIVAEGLSNLNDQLEEWSEYNKVLRGKDTEVRAKLIERDEGEKED